MFLLVDLYEAQKLIEDFERMRGNKLDIVALSKLTVNRLNLLNRINAIYLSQDRKITLDLDVVRNKGKELVENIDDVDIKKHFKKKYFSMTKTGKAMKFLMSIMLVIGLFILINSTMG